MKITRRGAVFFVAGALALAACSTATDEATTTTAADTEPTTTSQAPSETAPSTTTPTETPTRFVVEIANVSSGFAARHVEAFTTPVGGEGPAPALPGEAYEWAFEAAPGERVSFATMLVQSNDWFIGTPADGLPLFGDDSAPLTGDISADLYVWDGGTEVDQEPGVGEDQAPRQAGPDTGADDPDNTVRMVDDSMASETVSATLAHDGSTFTLTITNTSDASALPTPIAPGVGVVHGGGEPLFTDGEPDREEGLEALAEDGDPSGLVASVEAVTGVTTPLAPGAAAVIDMEQTVFTPGAPDDGHGLEALAEDGDPSAYAEWTRGTVFAVPSGATEPGPLFPGESYTVEVEALTGQYLTLETMLVQSNDWFFSLGAEGIPLFDAAGAPIGSDITDLVTVWDAGTEIDQTPGVGPDQAPRQAGPDTGADDPDPNVREVALNATDYIRVTITATP
ncbi:MAG: spondin domain-containing protein [Acidimicrobiia bacterium]